MKKYIIMILLLSSCSGETWTCVEDGTVMYSKSSNGEIGSAGKGCTCEEIIEYEERLFGEADMDALKRDFGCEPKQKY